jgi:hypothetical protein
MTRRDPSVETFLGVLDLDRPGLARKGETLPIEACLGAREPTVALRLARVWTLGRVARAGLGQAPLED